ncbi:hypothetical protein OTK49_03495 [Vibrio coralliirubri]|uniref:DUF3846 domain-containing protein n=1 Tax=Vibrio coralliirubri TaxID=1516159 RepID=UPI0022838436|nr:hypothetical protein [Vibrio coralliirubri]MCY9861582.1 hypothetical protein [Vibrio coralliirubri]
MTQLILIDPTTKTIEFVERKDKTLKSLYELADCEYFESMRITPSLVLLIDEEAKLRNKQQEQFMIDNQIAILGKGILCRDGNEGDNIDVTDADLEYAKQLFTF